MHNRIAPILKSSERARVGALNARVIKNAVVEIPTARPRNVPPGFAGMPESMGTKKGVR